MSGWTSLKTDLTTAEYLQQNYRYSDAQEESEPIKIVEQGSVVYMAIKHTKNGRTQVWALVVVVRRHGASLQYKTIAEWEGPTYFSCPEEILEMLTPTNDRYANAWRNNCRRGHATT